MSLEIRPLEHDDIAELRRIDQAAHGEAWSMRAFVDEIESDRRIHFVGLDQGRIVGHAAGWFDEPFGRVTNLAVDRAARGRRHGARLLLRLVHELLQPAIAALQLEVRATNVEARRLYLAFGFVPVGIERNFYGPESGLTNVDAIVMRAEVTNDAWHRRIDAIAAEFETGEAA